MPSINRIRLVNIQYDKGGKQYADELFRLHGKNSLLNLANGGGKTLWLQLVMQAALPGAVMGSRRMVDLLAHERYTGHILVEWKLDTFGEREFLLTGMCFTKAADEEGELKYFTYVYPYKIADELGIAKMPLVNDGRVISYQDFYQMLRKESKVQTFSQHDRRKYIQHIAQYHIYEKEWLAIRTTNGSEGGMDGFFSRSKTEQTLLENLLIPTVDQAIFQDDAEKQDLAHSFLKYKDKLLRIPQIEKNLEEFQLIEESGRSVVDRVAAHSDSRAQKALLEGQLAALKGLLGEMVTEREEEAAALDEVVKALLTQIREEEYKQASLDVNVLQAELRDGEGKAAQLAEQEQELADAEVEAEANVRLYRAVPKYLQIKELEKRLARDNETLSGLDKQNEDLIGELNRFKGQFITLWQERQDALKADHESKKTESLSWKQVEAQAEKEFGRLAAALNELSTTSGELNSWFKQYEKQKKAVRESLGSAAEEIVDNPVPERDNLRWQEIEAANAIREAEQGIESREQEIEQAQSDAEKEKDALRVVKRDKEKIEAKIEEFAKAKEKVQARLSLLDLERADLHGSRAELELRLTEKREGYAAEYGRHAGQKSALEDKRKLLADSDHYVPSQDLLHFQQVLADWGIESVPGSQWLQEREPEEREALVRSHPELPYALLLTDADLVKLRDPRLDWEGVQLESLIPLLPLAVFAASASAAAEVAATSAGTSAAEAGGQLLALGNDGAAFVGFHGGYRSFLSSEVLDRRREALDIELAEIAQKMDVVEKSRRHIEQVADDLGRFFEQYGKDPLAGWETKRDALELKRKEKEAELAGYATRITELRAEIVETKKAIKERQEELEALREKLRLLDPFATLAAEKKDKEAERREQQELEQELKAAQVKAAKSRQEAREQEDRLLPAMFALEAELTALQKEYELYIGSAATGEGIEAIPADEGLTYDTVQGKLESLTDLLSQKSVGRDELVRLIQTHEESVRENLAYIAEQKVSDELLSAFQAAPPASELTYWEGRLTEAKDERKAVEKERTALLSELKKTEGKIETEEKKVKKDYDRPAYDYGAEVDLAAEKERLKETLSDLWTQRKSNEGALAETKKSYDDAKTQLQKVETLLSAFAIECEPLELPEDRLKKLRQEPGAVVTELDKALSKTTKATEERRRELDDEFYRFERSIDKYESKIVQKFIRSVIDSKTEGDMHDIEQVRPVFEKCFEMMKLYIEKAHLEREELEEAKEELVHRCLQHAERVYDNLRSIAQYTKIDYRGKKVQAIDIQLKEKWEAPVGLRMMSQYLHALTEELQAKVSKNEDEDEIEKWLTLKLSSKHLLNVVAPIGEARIKVFKPQQVPGEKTRYDHWSEIMKWSGGEQYTGCFAMFIAVLSYLRAKMSGIENASKVLLADNPFGVVSSPHLLQVIFKLAQANRVQMICLSDHNKQSIYDLFEVVYSLKLVPALGRSVIQSTERRPESVMEAGFYEIDFDQEVETEQKSLLLE